MEILALLSGLFNVGTGMWQAFKSDELSKEERPTYKVPKEAEQALQVAKQQAYGDMPGAELAKRNIEQQQATGMATAQNVADSGSDILGFASSQNLATNRALGNLSAQEAQYKSNAMRNLQQALGLRAGYSDKEFDVNQMQPYLSSQQASSVLGEGAIQNIAGGVNASLTNYLGYKTQENLLDRMFGGGGNQTQTQTQTPQTRGGVYQNDWLMQMLNQNYLQNDLPTYGGPYRQN